MTIVSLILAGLITLFVLCFKAVTELYFKKELSNDLIIVLVFLVSFIVLVEILRPYSFCESAVLKVCPADRTEYVR